jgi:hypothetical protein
LTPERARALREDIDRARDAALAAIRGRRGKKKRPWWRFGRE